MAAQRGREQVSVAGLDSCGPERVQIRGVQPEQPGDGEHGGEGKASGLRVTKDLSGIVEILALGQSGRSDEDRDSRDPGNGPEPLSSLGSLGRIRRQVCRSDHVDGRARCGGGATSALAGATRIVESSISTDGAR